MDGREEDFKLETNPYHSEYKFIKNLGMGIDDVQIIDMGKNENLEFLNTAFGNTGKHMPEHSMDKFKLIECPRESLEAKAVAYIAKRVMEENKNRKEQKSVLVITPDAAGNQRIKNEFDALGLKADFSVGTPGNMTNTGRAILNLFDDWVEKPEKFDELFKKTNNDILQLLINVIDDENHEYKLRPQIDFDKKDDAPVWKSISSVSDILKRKIEKFKSFKQLKQLSVFDIRSLIADAISSVSVRQKLDDECNIRVLGMVESRMQKADVVILTGLNDGMFPAKGYENAWLPRDVSSAIGLPSSNKKVSLIALDFINLSCADEVYWLRTSRSSGAVNLESRFLSRVAITHSEELERDKEVLDEITKEDQVEENLFTYKGACMPIPKGKKLYVTQIEKLMNEPYKFYVENMLKLSIKDDYWVLPNNLVFGDAVHAAIQDAIEITRNLSAKSLKEKIKQNLIDESKDRITEKSALFYFWNKRIDKIADYLQKEGNYILSGMSETEGHIDLGNIDLWAKADIVFKDGVLDIKTGKIPEESQLKSDNYNKPKKPQIPLEGYILQNGGFQTKMEDETQIPKLMFLQLSRNRLRKVSYEGEKAKQIIDLAYSATMQIIEKYQSTDARYECKITSYGDSKLTPTQVLLKHFGKEDY